MKSMLIAVSILIISSLMAFSQEQLSLKKTYDIQEKQKKLYKLAHTWMEQQTGFEAISTNEVDVIEAVGHFNYSNPVKYEGSFTMSRAYADQTKGKFTYHFKMIISDNKLEVIITDFKHNPKNAIDKIDFGLLTENEAAPDYLKYDYDEKYVDQVWSNMKSQAKNKTEIILSTIPDQLVSAK